jgi:hypothetical protein
MGRVRSPGSGASAGAASGGLVHAPPAPRGGAAAGNSHGGDLWKESWGATNVIGGRAQGRGARARDPGRAAAWLARAGAGGGFASFRAPPPPPPPPPPLPRPRSGARGGGGASGSAARRVAFYQCAAGRPCLASCTAAWERDDAAPAAASAARRRASLVQKRGDICCAACSAGVQARGADGGGEARRRRGPRGCRGVHAAAGFQNLPRARRAGRRRAVGRARSKRSQPRQGLPVGACACAG